MKITDAKLLVENLLNTNNNNKLLEDDILNKFPELVSLTRQYHKNGIDVYRVIKLKENAEISTFKTSESTTTQIYSAAKIAKEMPDAIFSKDSLDKLDTYYLKFKLQQNDILLDINLILPILKEKLSKHMERYVSSNTEKMKLKEAFSLIENSDENEILANLYNKEYSIVKKPNYLSNFSLFINFKHMKENKEKLLYIEELEDQYNAFKDILMYDEIKLFKNYIKKEPLKKNKLK